MNQIKDEGMKTRVPAFLKAAIQKLAHSRFTSESAIAREAFKEYLERHAPQMLKDEASSAKAPASIGKPAVKALKSWRADERRLKRQNKSKTP